MFKSDVILTTPVPFGLILILLLDVEEITLVERTRLPTLIEDVAVKVPRKEKLID